MRFRLGLLGTACVALALSCTSADLNVPTQPDTDDGGTATDAGKKHDGGAEASTGDDDDDDDDDDDTVDSGGGNDAGDASTAMDAAHSDAGAGDAGPPPGGTAELSVIAEPSDKGAALFAAIKAAKTSIHMTMYLLTDDTFISDLTAAQAANVDVKVILNETFPSSGSDSGEQRQQLRGAPGWPRRRRLGAARLHLHPREGADHRRHAALGAHQQRPATPVARATASTW